MHQWGALQTRAASNVVIDIQHGAHVHGLEALDVDGEHRILVLHGGGAVDDHAGDVLDTVAETFPQSHLLIVDVLDTLLGNPLHASMQTADTQHVDGTGFETIRIFLKVVTNGGFHAGAAEAGVAHLHAFAHVAAANTGGSHQALVARKGVCVNVIVDHIHLHRTGALAAIDHEGDAVFLADLADLFDGLHRADDVGALRADHHLGVRTNSFFELLRMHITRRIKRQVSDLDNPLFLQMIERTKHGVVLQHRGDDMRALLRQTLNQDVQGIGGVVAERQTFLIGTAVEELGEHPACFRQNLTRLNTGVIARTSGAHTVNTIEMIHKLVNLIRFRERCC